MDETNDDIATAILARLVLEEAHRLRGTGNVLNAIDPAMANVVAALRGARRAIHEERQGRELAPG